jgi:hypothetical protein
VAYWGSRGAESGCLGYILGFLCISGMVYTFFLTIGTKLFWVWVFIFSPALWPIFTSIIEKLRK